MHLAGWEHFHQSCWEFWFEGSIDASLGFKRITPNLKQGKVEHYALLAILLFALSYKNVKKGIGKS